MNKDQKEPGADEGRRDNKGTESQFYGQTPTGLSSAGLNKFTSE